MKKLMVIALTVFALGFAGFSQAADQMKGEHMQMSEMKMMEQMDAKLNALDEKVTKILTLMQEKKMEKGKMMEEKGGMMEEKK
jgi:hypothetical protein